MNEEAMRKHYERIPKETLINILISSREQVEKLQKRNKERKQEIERLNKQLQLISDEFLKYDWENSSKEQVINQLKSLYNSIFKEKNI